MFSIIFFLALFISVISLFMTVFTNNGVYFLGSIGALIIFFPLYGICKSLGLSGSSDGIITTANSLIYIFKFLYIHKEIISIISLLIFYFIVAKFKIILKKQKLLNKH